MSDYLANLLRQTGQGLFFGTTDELEAAFRAGLLGEGEYYKLKEDIERRRRQWAEQNKVAATIAEMGGAVVPGIVGSFAPGGQGAAVASGARIARGARGLDAPLEALMMRYAPTALQAMQSRLGGRLAVGVGDEVINGAMYSAGQAPTMADIPSQIRDDVLQNAIASVATRGLTEGAAKGYSRARKYLKGKKLPEGVRQYIDENGNLVTEEDVVGSLAAMRRGGLAVKRRRKK